MGAALGGEPGDGGAGINLIDASYLTVSSNRIEGFRDDGIAMIGCSDSFVTDNWVKGIDSYLERQPGADGIWHTGTSFYATFMQSESLRPPTPQNISG